MVRQQRRKRGFTRGMMFSWWLCTILWQSDQEKNIQEISVEVGILVGRVHTIPHKDLNICYLCELISHWWLKSTLPSSVMALEHPPYSVDLSTPDFLFLQAKSVLKVQQFTSAKEVFAKATRALLEISKNGFKKCFQKLCV
jgi:hypothetical protein